MYLIYYHVNFDVGLFFHFMYATLKRVSNDIKKATKYTHTFVHLRKNELW